MDIHSKAYELAITFAVTATDGSSDLCSDPSNSFEFGVFGRMSSPEPSSSISNIGEEFTQIGIKVDCSTDSMLSILDWTRSGGTTIGGTSYRAMPAKYSTYAHLQSRHAKNASAAHRGTNTRTFELRVFFDHSVFEAYALDGIAASTLRAYPEDAADGLALYAKHSGAAMVISASKVEAWPMSTIWI